MKRLDEIKEYAWKCHNDTNHMYGDKPYTYHLLSVANIASHMIECHYQDDIDFHTQCVIRAVCYCHDIIEDARETFNDVLKATDSLRIADMVYALTNEKGKNRAERANDKYYEGIRECEWASFVKLCDRIANVTESKREGSSMFGKYRRENAEFVEKVVAEDMRVFYKPLIDELNSLLEI